MFEWRFWHSARAILWRKPNGTILVVWGALNVYSAFRNGLLQPQTVKHWPNLYDIPFLSTWWLWVIWLLVALIFSILWAAHEEIRKVRWLFPTEDDARRGAALLESERAQLTQWSGGDWRNLIELRLGQAINCVPLDQSQVIISFRFDSKLTVPARVRTFRMTGRVNGVNLPLYDDRHLDMLVAPLGHAEFDVTLTVSQALKDLLVGIASTNQTVPQTNSAAMWIIDWSAASETDGSDRLIAMEGVLPAPSYPTVPQPLIVEYQSR